MDRNLGSRNVLKGMNRMDPDSLNVTGLKEWCGGLGNEMRDCMESMIGFVKLKS